MGPYQDLPDNSTVWVYQSNREFSEAEKKRILLEAEQFIGQWAAHGNDLNATAEIFYDRFLVFFIDESSAQTTGCSIDKAVHFVQGLEKEFGVTLLDRMQVAYRNHGIKTLPLDDFRKKLENGELDKETLVFNNLVNTKKDLEHHWEVPVQKSWHKQLLPA